MDDAWLRAVETALNGETNSASARSLTLDGAVKCFQGRLPSPNLLERFQSLEHLSIANIGLTTLEKFPQLRNLQKLILTDNRISGGLEFLVEAGLDSLRDLDLSNNRIQYVEDLTPLAELKLVSLDLYECPVTKTKDYRSRVFGLIRSLKYLDKMDVDDNERPESDEEDDEEEEEEEDEEEEDDPGSGEIDGEGWSGKMSNGARSSGGGGGAEGVLDVDEDEESDADEEETETGRGENGYNRAPNHVANGGASIDGDEEEDDVDEEEDGDLGEEIDEEDGEEEDVVEVHEIDDSDDEEDGVEEEDDDEDEEVEDEEEDAERPSSGRVVSTEGEIDGHEQGEEDENGDEDENGEIGEEDGEYEEEDGEDEDEEDGEEFLVQPIGQGEQVAGGGSDVDAGNDEEEDGDEEVEDEEDPHNEVQRQPPSSSQSKRKRGDDSDDDDDDDDSIVDAKSSKLR